MSKTFVQEPCERRSYPAVAVEALGKSAIEESDLDNLPNGSAGINGCARFFRFLIRSTYHFMDRNSRNIAMSKGCKWELVTPRKLLTDQGSNCGIYCDSGVNPGYY